MLQLFKALKTFTPKAIKFFNAVLIHFKATLLLLKVLLQL